MKQYPHLVEIKNGLTVIQLPGRWELNSGSRIMIFNGQEVLVKGIFYMPLHVPDISLSWSATVFNIVYTGGVTQGFLSNQILIKPAVQIQTGVTQINSGIVFQSASNSAIIPDWQGWDIRPTRIGQDIMVRGRDYSWDASTALFSLLSAGDSFQPLEWFDIEFPIRTVSGIVNGQTVITATNAFLYASVIKQFSRGQLNARIWL